MKGVLKGSLFSLVLILITVVIAAFVNMKMDIPHSVLKGILWIVSVVCIFAGVLPVTKSATSGKLVRGIGCSLFTVIIMLIIASLSCGSLPLTGSFYAYSLICILCGLLASIVGINT